MPRPERFVWFGRGIKPLLQGKTAITLLNWQHSQYRHVGLQA